MESERDPGPRVPDTVLHYIAKSIAVRARRAGWSDSLRDDLRQEILATLWEQAPDLAAWVGFSNREFETERYVRFHTLLKRAVQVVLDRERRTPRVEVRPATTSANPKRVRQYLDPDRPLTPNEADSLVGREPATGSLDVMIDLARALDALPPPAPAVFRRKAAGETWDAIACDLGLTVAETRRLYTASVARLTRALKSYAPRAPGDGTGPRKGPGTGGRTTEGETPDGKT